MPASTLNPDFERRSRDWHVCYDWTTRVTGQLRRLGPDEILTTAYVRPNTFDPPGSGPDGFRQVWRQWTSFSRVSVLRDIPSTDGRNGPQCLAVHAGHPLACASPRSTVLMDDDMLRAARSMAGQRVRLIDMSEFFCDTKTCYAVIGGAPVYFDYDHMSKSFSATLAPFLLAKLT